MGLEKKGSVLSIRRGFVVVVVVVVVVAVVAVAVIEWATVTAHIFLTASGQFIIDVIISSTLDIIMRTV